MGISTEKVGFESICQLEKLSFNQVIKKKNAYLHVT